MKVERENARDKNGYAWSDVDIENQVVGRRLNQHEWL